ncbi:ABC-2 family transporter protein [Streptomyces sp. 900105755]
MTRLARLLRLHIVQQILGWSGSWWFAFALAAGQLMPPLIGLAVWHSVFPNSGYIATYYLCLLFTVATTASYENHTFSRSIYTGALSDELVKPQPTVLAPLGENIAIRAWIGLFALPVVLTVGAVVGADFSASRLLLAVPIWLCAGFLRFLFTWCLAMAAFWTERVHAITGLGTSVAYLLGGNAVPVNLLPSAWKTLAIYSPFYPMIGLPADSAAGLAVDTALLRMVVQVGWLILFGVMAARLWRSGLDRYTAVGR